MLTTVSLRQGQCELRFQELVEPSIGWPPAVLSKGPGVTFTAGSPIAVTGTPVPGYQLYMGSGLFGQQGFNCPESIR